MQIKISQDDSCNTFVNILPVNINYHITLYSSYYDYDYCERIMKDKLYETELPVCTNTKLTLSEYNNLISTEHTNEFVAKYFSSHKEEIFNNEELLLWYDIEETHPEWNELLIAYVVVKKGDHHET